MNTISTTGRISGIGAYSGHGTADLWSGKLDVEEFLKATPLSMQEIEAHSKILTENPIWDSFLWGGIFRGPKQSDGSGLHAIDSDSKLAQLILEDPDDGRSTRDSNGYEVELFHAFSPEPSLNLRTSVFFASIQPVPSEQFPELISAESAIDSVDDLSDLIESAPPTISSSLELQLHAIAQVRQVTQDILAEQQSRWGRMGPELLLQDLDDLEEYLLAHDVDKVRVSIGLIRRVRDWLGPVTRETAKDWYVATLREGLSNLLERFSG